MNTPKYRVKFYMKNKFIYFKDYVTLTKARETAQSWSGDNKKIELIRLKEEIIKVIT